MTFEFQPWMRTALIVLCVIFLIGVIVFLYLLTAGADESRRHKEPTQKIVTDHNQEKKMDLARFLCDYSSDDLRVQSSGDMSGSFLQ